MDTFQKLSVPLIEMIDFVLKENKIGWLGTNYTCKKIRSIDS